MTAQDQAFDVAKRYIHGSNKEKEIILSCFTGEEKEIAIQFFGYYKLFCDQRYYDAVKGAVCAKCLKDIYG